MDFLFVPGVSTASEMSQALSLGCLFQKFFPAETAGGVRMLKSLLAAFRHTGVRIMPTGGINAGNHRLLAGNPGSGRLRRFLDLRISPH